MSDKTGIEWCDATWNCIRGCSRVSEGCRHCYAERVAARFAGVGMPYEGLAYNGRWTGKVRLIEERLEDPLRWKKPRRIFVNSMSDLFHEGLPDEAIDRVFAVMARAPQHTFQILTKRPEQMRFYMHSRVWKTIDAMKAAARDKGVDAMLQDKGLTWPLPNVWLGVSVEDQKTADERIPLLLKTHAVVRFISAEPLLGPIDLLGSLLDHEWRRGAPGGLGWVIVGGESGPGARPMHPAWARSLRDQCQVAGAPFFFKQWGEWSPGSDRHYPGALLYGDGRTCGFTKEAILAEERRSGKPHDNGTATYVSRLGKSKAGRLLDERTWDEMPEARP